jgi:transcription antitermination factor NusG
MLKQEVDMENQEFETKRALSQHQWYVIYTRARSEKKVYERLLDEQFECYLPTYKALRQWSDRKKLVELPLFNSYIFVKVMESELASVLKVFGVVKFVHYVDKPAVVRQKEIDGIREFLRQTEGYRIRVQKGDKVQISTGLLMGIKGEVLRITKSKVIIRIEQLGLSIVATIPRGQLKKPLGAG